ncbi:unnamed protein product (macronuclear) [Paramecium tetraurelia]|uniref:Uncharacterized protein n=1 Tax=Paramecium tetraurelia TaxID=5888 RepID=A0CN14_PARTE|nr:uncharacterized protein GSPATT00008622001 [Paramecium tetraurelia]CAK72181.1 unnamed protein product [Paramecium tetraurelia]|eukprot:XP_001439578.1 hypothetical protein (macronuclear) [Paramecium tetraurelia strain d4-2]
MQQYKIKTMSDPKRGPATNTHKSFLKMSLLFSTQATARFIPIAMVGFIHPPEWGDNFREQYIANVNNIVLYTGVLKTAVFLSNNNTFMNQKDVVANISPHKSEQIQLCS